MSILIKGMEIPKACVFCELYEGETHWCRGAKKEIPYSSEYERADNCPLVEIPPHGRLIDADALSDAIESTDWYHQAPNKEMVHGANSAEHQAWYKEQDIYYALENAPTIIESTIGQLNSDSAVNKANANTSNALNALDCVEESEASR